jgi:aspartate--ammonia ligase
MEDVKPLLNFRETEFGIVKIKESFQSRLSQYLNLIRVSAPKFLAIGTGLQDDLAGTCESVKFLIPDYAEHPVELVHSLAKWKRNALHKYGFGEESGIYTDMDAIRKDEKLDEIHSVYVDQYDWEKCISDECRTLDYLKKIVTQIYQAIRETETTINKMLPALHTKLPNDIKFIHSEDLYESYPDLTPKEREYEITKKYGAVFVIGIGYKLYDDIPHDIRAVDYDDWSTPTEKGYHGLNGDILVWDEVIDQALELSSMGIRVNAKSLIIQSKLMDQKIDKPYHKLIIENILPQSIGGGIGQSRLAMFLLEKRHIGEVQVSTWPSQMHKRCLESGISLL